MNREIKFRVWTGSRMEHKIMAGFLGVFFVQGMDEHDSACMSEFNTKYENCPVMQFIGLRAKNGDIYEGDIVHWPGWDGKTYQVCYDRWGIPALAGIKDSEGGDFKEFEMNYNATPAKCEILGNIYENPELLEVKA